MPAEPRDINTLLALDTYQGMTDEEIGLIVEYTSGVAAAAARAEALVEHTDDLAAQVAAANVAASQFANETLARLVASPPALEVVVADES